MHCRPGCKTILLQTCYFNSLPDYLYCCLLRQVLHVACICRFDRLSLSLRWYPQMLRQCMVMKGSLLSTDGRGGISKLYNIAYSLGHNIISGPKPLGSFISWFASVRVSTNIMTINLRKSTRIKWRLDIPSVGYITQGFQAPGLQHI